MAKILGKAYIKVDGALLLSQPDASLDIGGTVRTARIGNKVHGYSETEKQSELECKIDMDSTVSLAAIRNWSDVTITFETDVGKSYVIRNAFCVNPPKVTGGDGSGVDLMFQGPPAEEM